MARANWSMQLIDVRVNTELAGAGPSLLTSIPDHIVDNIAGYLESSQDPAIKQATDRERPNGALPRA